MWLGVVNQVRLVDLFMHTGILPALYAAFIAVMLWTAYYDLRNRIIQHRVVLGLMITAPLTWWAAGLPLLPTIEWGQHWLFVLGDFFQEPEHKFVLSNITATILVSILLFLMFTIFFALGMMGGGDVKLMGAMGLWLMPIGMIWLLIIEAIAGLVVTALAFAHHRWRKKEGQTEVPRGVSIAFAGIWVIGERYLNQFS
jgi:prepilin peptidase CpaA